MVVTLSGKASPVLRIKYEVEKCEPGGVAGQIAAGGLKGWELVAVVESEGLIVWRLPGRERRG